MTGRPAPAVPAPARRPVRPRPRGAPRAAVRPSSRRAGLGAPGPAVRPGQGRMPRPIAHWTASIARATSPAAAPGHVGVAGVATVGGDREQEGSLHDRRRVVRGTQREPPQRGAGLLGVTPRRQRTHQPGEPQRVRGRGIVGEGGHFQHGRTTGHIELGLQGLVRQLRPAGRLELTSPAPGDLLRAGQPRPRGLPGSRIDGGRRPILGRWVERHEQAQADGVGQRPQQRHAARPRRLDALPVERVLGHLLANHRRPPVRTAPPSEDATAQRDGARGKRSAIRPSISRAPPARRSDPAARPDPQAMARAKGRRDWFSTSTTRWSPSPPAERPRRTP